MALLDILLEIQDLDLAADAARDRSANLPERESLPLLDRALAEIETQSISTQTEQAALRSEEEEVGTEVTEIAREIEAAEVERYSGKRFDRDDAKAHDESQRLLRD